jgi:DNA-nicking Smr family endonuclease
MSKLKLDLHEIYNKGGKIDSALRSIIQEALDKKIRELEIIPGKGSGQLKKRVIRYLNQPDVKHLYHRYKIDNKNFGRLFVYFK